MDIITTPSTTNEIELSPGARWLQNAGTISAASPDVAINRPLADLVQATLTASANDSENTARAYSTALGLFFVFLGNELGDKLPPEWQPLATPTKEGRKTVWEFRGLAAILRVITAATIDNFTAWRSGQGDGRQTLALRRGAVMTFLKVAYRENVLTHDQALNMGLKPYAKKQRRDDKPVGRRLAKEEVRLLREIVLLKARTDNKAARDRAILDCMLYAGLRRDEVASLTTGSLKQDGGRYWIVLTGKGLKTRRVKCHDTLWQSLADWCQLAGLPLGHENGFIFGNLTKGGNLTGKPLNASVIGRIVAEYGALADLAPREGANCLSPHDLRRTCARNAFDNGASLPQVQAMLGHADVKTTMRYIGSVEDDDHTAIDHIKY